MTTTGVNLMGTSADDVLIGTAFNDTLNGDFPGEAGGHDRLEGLGGNDSLIAGVGNDTLLGGEGNDTLSSSSGPDLLEGGPGDDVLRTVIHFFPVADTLLGGDGNDRFETPTIPVMFGVPLFFDRIIDGGNGIDTVILSAQATLVADLAETDHFKSIENAIVSRGSATITGTAADNLLAAVGRMEAHGLDGNDTVFGGIGSDSLEGDNGNDWLIGNAGADTLIGSNGDDLFFGTDDNDLLLGGAGSDTMFGEREDDVLNGGEDGDRYIGGEGADMFRLDGGSGLDTIYDFKRSEGDRISLAANINGSGITSFSQLVMFADAGGTLIFLGNGEGGANWLAVLGVNDLRASDFIDDLGPTLPPVSLVGGNGSDFLFGTAFNDTLEGSFFSVDSGNDTLIGFAGDDLITGGRTANQIDAGAGNDIIIVPASLAGIPAGRDMVLGGAGNDLVSLTNKLGTAASTQFTVDGGEGFDKLELSQDDLTITTPIDLATGIIGVGDVRSFAGFERYSLFGQWAVSGTEGSDIVECSSLPIAQGLGGDDTIFGGSGFGFGFPPPDDSLDGGEGNDWLIGRFGNDTLIGGNGDDILWGTEGRDLLLGGAGNDNIFGEDGIDTLNGGAGADSLSGGNNGDVFHFESGSGLDLIFDFSRAEGDRISIAPNVNGSGITSFANLTLFADTQGTRIDLGGGIQITVLAVFDLQAGDFIFA